MPRESGASSIPETAVIESRGRGVLDRPPQCASAHKAGDDGRGCGGACTAGASLLPHPLLQPRHRDTVARELIGALILRVTGVALDPVPAHVVLLQRGIEALP